jgi:hypothetical protein
MATRSPAHYTPRNRAELVSCLIGLGDNQLVELKPNATNLLRRRFRAHREGRAQSAGVAIWPPAHRDPTASVDRGGDRASLDGIERGGSPPTSPSCHGCCDGDQSVQRCSFVGALPSLTTPRSLNRRYSHPLNNNSRCRSRRHSRCRRRPRSGRRRSGRPHSARPHNARRRSAHSRHSVHRHEPA